MLSSFFVFFPLRHFRMKSRGRGRRGWSSSSSSSSSSSASASASSIAFHPPVPRLPPIDFLKYHPSLSTPLPDVSVSALHLGTHFFRTPSLLHALSMRRGSFQRLPQGNSTVTTTHPDEVLETKPSEQDTIPSTWMTSFNEWHQGGPSLGHFPEMLFLGPSNTGKSSLLNVLCEEGRPFLNKSKKKNALVKVSKRPGTTHDLAFISLNNKCYLVDSMGYGEGSQKTWGEKFETYLCRRKELCKLYWLIPCTQPNLSSNDMAIFHLLLQAGLPFHVVLTKIDLSDTPRLCGWTHLVHTHLIDPSFGLCQGIVYVSTKTFVPHFDPTWWCPNSMVPTLSPPPVVSLNRIYLLPEQVSTTTTTKGTSMPPRSPSSSSSSSNAPNQWVLRHPGVAYLQSLLRKDVLEYRRREKSRG
ncbi:hypothetical protein HMI54_001301 [Coelomomyces lativittatus]|nr:hypothetical protein HMI54_001301 [Coelomomyces lativittatus]KAJ1511469.1 hypothetical protein HMI55_006584 [Coelomomyces lativittatus]KAJ1512101.1 hypothetical protein HMI56_004508 [Coelomomyces lativittatus]